MSREEKIAADKKRRSPLEKSLEGFLTPGQVILAMKVAKVQLALDEPMVGQILDALEVRREAWQKTSAWYRGELNDPFFAIEECRDDEEADSIAAFYLQIETELREQLALHRSQYPRT